MIKLKYSSVDGFRDVKVFKTLKGARKYAQERIGVYPEMGSFYAVSGDGVGKIELVGDTYKLADLFGNYPEELTSTPPNEPDLDGWIEGPDGERR